MTTVSLSHLSVAFHGHTVLHNVSANFPAKRISVLIGRSGSGKTTLLRAINRLNEEFADCVTTGQVHIDFGQGACTIYQSAPLDGMPLPELRRRVGMLFQAPNCFPVSIYRNIAMPLTLIGGIASEDLPSCVQDALQAVGLWKDVKDRLNLPAERLSGGQQQRLCLARLLALRPSVLLLDEPTASLDVHAARDIEALLLKLAAEYTIIMVSHELAQAQRMAHQVLVCEQGTLVETYDDPAQLNSTLLAERL